jgi:hypothetical protein
MVKGRPVSPEAKAKYDADVALAERFDELFAQAQAAEQALRGAQADGAREEELYRAAKRLDSALTDVMRAAFAAQRAAIGPRGYDDRIYRRKALATPTVRTWTMEAERLLTLRESHRLTGIPRLPPRPPPRKTTTATTGEPSKAKGVPVTAGPDAVYISSALAASVESISSAIDMDAKRDDEYRRFRLALEQMQTEVHDIENRHDTITTIAQQFLVIDVTIVGIMAAAALGVEQIRLQLTQLFPKGVPVGDAALARGGLIGIVILAAGAIVSACFAAAGFLGEKTDLGPSADDLAKQTVGFSAAEQTATAAVAWRSARDPARQRLQSSRRWLNAAVGTLILGVAAAPVVAVLVWR